MMKCKKNFVRNNKNIVLLVCDFYDTRQIPQELTDTKENLSLFPVANIPIIEYILRSLYNQNLRKVILAGSNIKPIRDYVKGIDLAKMMKIMIHSTKGNSFGDLMRDIDELDYDFKDLLIMFANHYTNFDLKRLFERHREDDNTLATFFLHPSETNSSLSFVYGTKGSEIVHYEKSYKRRLKPGKMQESLENIPSVKFDYKLSSPSIAVVSSSVFSVFTENFDFSSLGDMIEGILAFNPNNYKIRFMSQVYEESTDLHHSLFRKRNHFYSREIITLQDYYKINEDVKLGVFDSVVNYKKSYKGEVKSCEFKDGNYIFGETLNPCRPPIKDSILGCNSRLINDFHVKSSFVGNCCVIEGNINRCIIWDDVTIRQDFSDHIIFSDNRVVSVDYLEIEMEYEEEEKECSSFFDDVFAYLKSLIDDSVGYPKLEIDDVIRQVNLLKIIWNASNLDLLEAFSVFIVNMVDEEDIDTSTINISVLFPVIETSINNFNDEEYVLEFVYNLLKDKPLCFRKEVFYRYGYLLVEDGFVSRPALKKYNKMCKKGIF